MGEKSKTSLFCRFWLLKIHRIHTHSNTCHALNFNRNFDFFLIGSEQCPLSESKELKLPKTAKYGRMVALYNFYFTLQYVFRWQFTKSMSIDL